MMVLIEKLTMAMEIAAAKIIYVVIVAKISMLVVGVMMINLSVFNMKRFSKNKNIHKLVLKLIKDGWVYRSGKKHGVIIAPKGYRMAVPSTPSDFRADKNFKQSVALIRAKGI